MDIKKMYDKRKRLMALIILCALLLPTALITLSTSAEYFGAEREDSIQAVKIASQVRYRKLERGDIVRFLKDDMMIVGQYAVNTEENIQTGYSRETGHYYVVVFMDGDNELCYASLLIDKDNPHFFQVSSANDADLTGLDLSGYYQCRTVKSRGSELAGFYAEAIEMLRAQVGELATDTGLIFTYTAGTDEEYSEMLEREKDSSISGAVWGLFFSISCIIGIVYGIITRRKIAAQIQEQYAWQARFVLQQNDNP